VHAASQFDVADGEYVIPVLEAPHVLQPYIGEVPVLKVFVALSHAWPYPESQSQYVVEALLEPLL
jgi:hypothetical protein